MAHTSRGRTARRTSLAQSVTSDSPYTPHATPPPTRRSGAGTRGVRQDTIDGDAQLEVVTVQATRIPTHYSLPPTVPSPFEGTLEASLDAVLDWGSENAGTQCVVDALLQPVNTATNWPDLLRTMDLNGGSGSKRALLESFLFLVTRTLLPEQIAENRVLMDHLYDRKKQLAIRLVLRYDMLREWKMDHTWHPMAVASLPPANVRPPEPISSSTHRALMPNIVSTLIVAPVGGWTTHAVRERMKHHITALDTYLILTDGEVAGWSGDILVGMASQIALQWQWLRQNNEVLEEMEIFGWEDLEGRADECEWIADDVKKGEWSKGSKKAVVAEE